MKLLLLLNRLSSLSLREARSNIRRDLSTLLLALNSINTMITETYSTQKKATEEAIPSPKPPVLTTFWVPSVPTSASTKTYS